MQIKRIAALLVVAGGLGMGGVVTLILVLFVARAWWTIPFEVLGFGGAPKIYNLDIKFNILA